MTDGEGLLTVNLHQKITDSELESSFQILQNGNSQLHTQRYPQTNKNKNYSK